MQITRIQNNTQQKYSPKAQSFGTIEITRPIDNVIVTLSERSPGKLWVEGSEEIIIPQVWRLADDLLLLKRAILFPDNFKKTAKNIVEILKKGKKELPNPDAQSLLDEAITILQKPEIKKRYKKDINEVTLGETSEN